MYPYLALAAGLVLLIAGGEMLVRGASSLAARLGMSPLLIGITLVGFGTSMPELVTSVEASLLGSPGIALGNIVGSNIANILLILGLAAMLAPLPVSRQALYRDGTVVLVTAAALVAVAHLRELDRIVGLVFVAGLLAYLYFAYLQERTGAPEGHSAAFEKRAAHDEVAPLAETADTPRPTTPWLPLLLAIAGLATVIVGGKVLVDAAIAIARTASISETVIGLTIVAVGTSLPELATSVIAALRRHTDVALGNILGSNIYNVLAIAGITGLIAPTSVPPEIVRFDSLVMLAVSALILVMGYAANRIARWHGAALFAGYAAYIVAIWPAA